MSVCFAQFHPNLLVGGSYSGQIVLWDNRSRKRTPVQKTPLSASAHTVCVICFRGIHFNNIFLTGKYLKRNYDSNVLDVDVKYL